MNSFIETSLKTFCSSHKMFEESSTYVRFEMEPGVNGDEKPDGLNSDPLFGRIVYQTRTKEERISPSIMLKRMTPNPVFEDFVQVQYFNEILFHVRAEPILQSLANMQWSLAKFYDSYVHSNQNETEFLLIYENLKPQGFRTHDCYTYLDAHHLFLMFRRLGRFHSYSYRLKRTDPKQFHRLGKWFYDAMDELVRMRPNFHRILGQRGLRRLQKHSPDKAQLAKVEELVENGATFLLRLNTMERDRPMSVLCHGDYLRGNVMFRYENGQPVDLKMIDMATCRIASPVIDLSALLYLNADQKTRDEYWDQLIDSYYEGLCEIFGPDDIPSRDSIVNEFHTKAVYAYFVASYFLPNMIAVENNMPDFCELWPPEYASYRHEDVPDDVFEEAAQQVGGEEATEALASILRDMIKRNFI